MVSRGRKILELMQNLNLPKYESTKGTDEHERTLAVLGWNQSYPKRNVVIEYNDESDSEDKSSGSEYIPSDCSSDIDSNMDSSKPKKRHVFNEVESMENMSEAVSLNNNENFSKVATDIDSNMGSSQPKKRHVFNEGESMENMSEAVSLNNNENVSKVAPRHNRLPVKRAATVMATADSTTSISLTTSSDVNEKEAKTGALIIHAARKTDNGKRIRDKRHSCYFCQTEIINVARHLEIKHGKELEIARLLAKPKNSQRRKEGFTEIVRAGDFYHNCNVTAAKEGELILVRRPTTNEIKFITYNDYGPCPNCLGFMLKKHLWHHIKKNCNKTRNPENSENAHQNRHIIAESNSILSNVFGTEFTTDYKTNIINSLRGDDVGNYCREDLLILKFGGMLFEKYGITQCELIRQLMRQVARLVLTIRDLSIQKLTLSDLLVPEKFDIVVQGTKNLCGSIVSNSTKKKPEFETPSLALKIEHSLKKCANIERGLALRNSDLNKNETLISFINLLELEWQIRISSNALATLYKRKLNVGQLLPITSDLTKLNNYIDQEMDKTKKTLIKTPNVSNWSYLATLTLCRIILFNKRRVGEAARMTIQQYATRPSWSQQSNEELKNSLTPYEKKLAERLAVVNVIGKRGAKVPVILTPEVKASMDILLKFRSSCGIAQNNPYIFARGNQALSNKRGHDCLREIVNNVELEKPEYITGTKLRKYVATVCQIFNLTENEHDWLARHLGHDITVHREFYRLHEDAVELTKVSRLLMAVDKGEANKFVGRTLSDIHIEDLPPVEEDDDPDILEDVDVEDIGGKDVDYQTPEIHEPDANKMEVVISNNLQGTGKPRKGSKSASARGKTNSVKTPWTAEDKRFVFDFFKIQIKNGIVPGKEQCLMCQQKHPSLLKRKWSALKFCVKNQITKISKMKSK